MSLFSMHVNAYTVKRVSRKKFLLGMVTKREARRRTSQGETIYTYVYIPDKPQYFTLVPSIAPGNHVNRQLRKLRSWGRHPLPKRVQGETTE